MGCLEIPLELIGDPLRELHVLFSGCPGFQTPWLQYTLPKDPSTL